jgi:hypothetical protein
MMLSEEQNARFFRVWLALLGFVNDLRRPTRQCAEVSRSMSLINLKGLRDELWRKENRLLDRFIAENPARLSALDLETAAGWRERIAGRFFAIRFLKKYAVFLQEGSPPRAYGVLGISNPVKESLPPWTPPIYVDAVLLPFDDVIIYDSLLAPYDVYFGPGVREELDHLYAISQEHAGVITDLRVPTGPRNRKELDQRNHKTLAAFREDLAAWRLSAKTIERDCALIYELAADVLANDLPPRSLLALRPDDLQAYFRQAKKKPSRQSFKRFLRFLLETGRLDEQTIDSLSATLEQCAA